MQGCFLSSESGAPGRLRTLAEGAEMLAREWSHSGVLSQRGSKDMVPYSAKALRKAGRGLDGGWAPVEKQTWWGSKAAVEGRGRARVPLPDRKSVV